MDDHRELGGKLTIHGKTYAVFGGLNPVGRNREAVVNIKHLGVSQNHALLILVDDDLHFISDLKSSNGTYLNGEKLSPLQLYRIDSGFRLKFANIEGTYSKCCSDDGKFAVPNNSQFTQNQTQSFYGADTQIIDDTLKGDRKTFIKSTQYVPTQDLVKAASALEKSYVALHEQPTQLFDNTSDHEKETQLVDSNADNNQTQTESQYVNITTDAHEAETQKVTESQFLEAKNKNSNLNVTDIHECETQIVVQEEVNKKLSGISGSEIIVGKSESRSSVHDQNSETKQPPIECDTNTPKSNSIVALQNTSESIPSNSTSQEAIIKDVSPNADKVEDKSLEFFQESNLEDSDSDIVRPVRISNNRLDFLEDKVGNSSQEPSLGDSDSDIVRPVGKSTNKLDFIEDKVRKGTPESSLGDADSDIVKPVRKSSNRVNFLENESRKGSQEGNLIRNELDITNPRNSNQGTSKQNNDIEMDDDDDDTNDSLDFMTMQKINDADKKCSGENDTETSKEDTTSDNKDNSKSQPKEAIQDNQQISDEETDIEHEEICGKEDGSETDNDDECLNNERIKTNKSTKDMKNMEAKSSTLDSDSETEIETESNEKNSNSSTNDKKKRSNLKRKKKFGGKILDSDSESDEIEVKKKYLHKIESPKSESDDEIKGIKRKSMVFYSQSDTDVEKNNDNSVQSNKSFSIVIDESNFADESFDPKVDVLGHNSNASKPDDYLDESDVIPATQDYNPKTSKNISQDSKFENSEESFRLGLTQLMEDDSNKNDTSQKVNTQTKAEDDKENEEVNDLLQGVKSQNSQKVKKVFVFKKSSKNFDSVSNTQDDEMYEAKTQNLFQEPASADKDEHIFLQPTPKSRSKKTVEERDEIYMLSTQTFGESPVKNAGESFYMQSTQKLDSENRTDPGEGTSGVEIADGEIYQQATQKLADSSAEKESKDEDPDDMFASQQINQKTTPSKRLESELAFMFNTQRSLPPEESLETIKNILHQNQIVDSTLPEGDSDLEAILATQKISESPKSSRNSVSAVTSKKVLGHSIESQLEVLFASQTASLPPDKFERPLNPLANIFGEDTQEIEPVKGNINTSEKVSLVNSFGANDTIQNLPESSRRLIECDTNNVLGQNVVPQEIEPLNGNKNTVANVSMVNSSCTTETTQNLSKSMRRSTKGGPNNALEQSFALLESKCTKVRRSARKSNLEEVTVSCRKSRISMAVAPNDALKKIVEEKSVRGMKDPKETRNKFKEPKRKRELDIATTSRRASKKNSEQSHQENSDHLSEYPKSEKLKKDIIDEKEVSDTAGEESTSRLSRSRKPRVERIKATNETRNKFKEPQPKRELENASTSKKTTKENSIQTNHENGSNKSNENLKTKISKNNLIDENEEFDAPDEKSISKVSRGRKSKLVIEEDSDTGHLSNNVKKKRGGTRSTTEDDSSSSCSSGIIDTRSECATPSRKRHQSITPTPSTSSIGELDVTDTPSRKKRKLKPKVVFTMMEDPKLESEIRYLGGNIVDSVKNSTVLIAPSVKRSLKLLTAVGLGTPICSAHWVKASKKEDNFLDPWDYILIDKEAETKWDFSLKTSLERSSQVKLFEGYTFQLMVTTTVDVLKGAIESCGGKIVSRTPKSANNFVVVATDGQSEKYKKLLKQQPRLTIIEPEAIFDGVLRQEIRFEKHLLH